MTRFVLVALLVLARCGAPSSPDAGSFDAGSTDAGSFDAGSPDAGAVDAGTSDAGSVDAGSVDAGPVDAGSVDAGSFDAGSVDAGSFDAGDGDAGSTDAGAIDAGAIDAGCPRVCGDGRVECGEVCDFAAGPCCSGTCDGYANGTVCRPAAGVCDLAELCPGNTGACPMDVKRILDVCRAAAGDCDVPEQCDGVRVDCPPDVKRPPTTTCRLSSGLCDVAELCTGVSNDCPPDGRFDAGVPCRNPVGACDRVETCDGVNVACPSDQLLPSGTVCRPAAGTCDVAESCTGMASQCPVDQLVSAATVCRPPWTACDLSESCTGASVSCPADAWRPQDAGCPGPRVTPNTTSIDFGDLGLGSSAQQTVTFTNDGGLPLVGGASFFLAGADVTDFTVTSRCTGDLRPGTSCGVDMIFRPVTLGTKTAVVSFATPPPATINLIGNAWFPATLSLSPTIIDFAPIRVGQMPTTVSNITVYNAIGTARSGLIVFVLNDVTNFSFVPPTIGTACTPMTQLVAGSACTIGLRFAPASVGQKTAIVTVTASPGGTVNSTLRGTGTP